MRLLLRSSTFCLLAAALGVAESVHGDAGDRAIYRCDIGGVPTFSDLPCAPVRELREVDLGHINTVPAPEVRPSARPERRAKPPADRSKNTSRAPADAAKQARTCARLAKGLERLRSKLRAGYTAEEGERLKRRASRFKSQLRAAQCD